MRPLSRAAAPSALYVVLLWASPVSAQSLDRARQLYLDADFRGAAEAFDEVLGAEDLELEVAAAAHGALAALRLMLGEEDIARLHAEAAVALDPEVTVPDGSPEAAAELLRRAAASGVAAELAIEAEEPLVAGEVASVAARLEPAPRLLAATLRLSCESDAGTAEEQGPPAVVRLSVLADGAALRCQAAALSAGGAALISVARELAVGGSGESSDEVASSDVRAEVEPAVEPEVGSDAEPSPEPRWPGWLWVGIGAGALVLVAVVTVVLVLTLGPQGNVVLTQTEIEGW